MPPQKTPAPIDRPIAKAYVREFSGLSTAFPPGLSDPTSLRVMENLLVNKDGSLRVRPGLRYLSRSFDGSVLGGLMETPVGTHEAFYFRVGDATIKAYLFAVREADDTVGFRVLVVDVAQPQVVRLDTVFSIPQGEAGDDGINFTAQTTYVKYLQVDNVIFALSDAGETMRMFEVGETKIARRLLSIGVPAWDFNHKLNVYHPDGDWVTGNLVASRLNLVFNPSFPTLDNWEFVADASVQGTGTEGPTAARVQPAPQRKNLQKYPLRTGGTADVTKWLEYGAGTSTLTAQSDAIRVQITCTKKGGQGFARQSSDQGAAVVAGQSYKAAFDLDAITSNTTPIAYVLYVNASNTVIGRSPEYVFSTALDRKTTGTWTPPAGTVRALLLVGGKRTTTTSSTRYVQFKQVLIARSTEATTFFSGADGAGYVWEGAADESASIYTADTAASGKANKAIVEEGEDYTASISAKSSTPGHDLTIGINWYSSDDDADFISSDETTTAISDVSSTRVSVTADAPVGAVRGQLYFETDVLTPGEYYDLDGAMLEHSATLEDYFDGDTSSTLVYVRTWMGTPHGSNSRENEYAPSGTLPPIETAAADTLISNVSPTADEDTENANIYNFGFFYCFENEVGESAHSQVKVIRTQRPWQAWRWLTPSGTSTDDPEACADQLVAVMPESVFNAAMLARATNWSLYMITWTNQAPVPVTAVKIAEVALDSTSTYVDQGWARMTPQQVAYEEIATIPTETNRYNYSDPPRGGQGLVAADRLVVVKDPYESAVIRWSANEQGEYYNFSVSRGGGYKTLTSGNLFITACVKLWQNPQSVDTLTILCDGTDGHSTGYYMAPATVNSQSESITIMGFEETTATPGTVSPYGCEVFNNTLYHPLDDQLMKSSAANYNITHKSVTDQIENIWTDLVDKDQIVSSQLDKRLYFIVHNPSGEGLQEGARGNEIWIYDAETDKGTWSRFLIQGVSLRKIELNDLVYMSVVTPTGIFYLDPEAGNDEFVADDLTIQTRNIPWYLQTNVQGANRAHDAWCRLQHVQVTMGNFIGTFEYGLRSKDINGQDYEIRKTMRDLNAPSTDGLPWDIHDILQVRRDLMEWYFFAGSTVDSEGAVVASQGQLSLLQYRYLPVSVNVGYEYGSIESFEYQRATFNWADRTTDNGVPQPFLDTRRP